MYIGGTDERALHHLVANCSTSVDEAVAGPRPGSTAPGRGLRVTVLDNAAHPVDPHPKFKKRSARRILPPALGRKFAARLLDLSGLHGGACRWSFPLGASVVDARDRTCGPTPTRAASRLSAAHLGAGNRRGTIVSSITTQIFGPRRASAALLYRMARSSLPIPFMAIRLSCLPRWLRDPACRGSGPAFPVRGLRYLPPPLRAADPDAGPFLG